MPTTSQPPRRTRSKGSAQHGNPLKSIRLTLTLVDSRREELGRLAAEKGLTFEEKGGAISLSFTATTADEALERLKILASLLVPKG